MLAKLKSGLVCSPFKPTTETPPQTIESAKGVDSVKVKVKLKGQIERFALRKVSGNKAFIVILRM